MHNRKAQRTSKLCRCVEYRSRQRLRIVREHFSNDDQSDGEEGVNADRHEELRDKGIGPVGPLRLDDSHEEGGDGAEKRGSDDDPDGRDAVDEEAHDKVEGSTDYKRREHADGCLQGRQVLDFLEAKQG